MRDDETGDALQQVNPTPNPAPTRTPPPNPPPNPNPNLAQRSDDTEKALRKRLQGYHAQTVPVLGHYEEAGVVSRVDASTAPDAVWRSVAAALPK